MRSSMYDAKHRALYLVKTQTTTHFVCFLPIFRGQKEDIPRGEQKLKKEGGWTPKIFAYFAILAGILMSKVK